MGKYGKVSWDYISIGRIMISHWILTLVTSVFFVLCEWSSFSGAVKGALMNRVESVCWDVIVFNCGGPSVQVGSHNTAPLHQNHDQRLHKVKALSKHSWASPVSWIKTTRWHKLFSNTHVPPIKSRPQDCTGCVLTHPHPLWNQSLQVFKFPRHIRTLFQNALFEVPSIQIL